MQLMRRLAHALALHLLRLAGGLATGAAVGALWTIRHFHRLNRLEAQ